jgi:Fe-S oxidoreductase
VDLAAYKAEFLSHWYEHHPRPLSAHLFGFIDRWSRLAAHAPGLANACTNALAPAIKRAAGIARERTLPRFAARTFRADFDASSRGAGQREVVLWPDTFNNHFHPQVAHAAVQVLRRAGFHVRLPAAGLCCGRPLYEHGFLAEARAYLQRILASLDEDLRAGTPIVLLEPACLSVFREELPLMLPRDEQAHRLRAQAVLLPDFLQQHAKGLELKPPAARALVHGHCHHKGVLGFDAEMGLLKDRLHLQVDAPDTGCCGMAGSFGFEADKLEVSLACAERVLLPAVRAAAADTLVVADGFSCREQIVQCTGHEVLHLAEVLARALP